MNESQIKDRVYREWMSDMNINIDDIKVDVENKTATINCITGEWYYKLTSTGKIKKNSLRKNVW
jgi:hypothetical protein